MSSREIGPFSPAPEELGARLLSDEEVAAALARLEAGEECFRSAVMRRRFGETIVERLWGEHEQPVEPD